MGKTPCCDKNGLKKGPWTAEEDQKLIDYIQKHGQGRWRILPKNAGLKRCGKSCRLRWTNYLRPDIKRGRFSLEEEDTIIQLHCILGNKWSAIAARLPGRTDNEIKNYWNTHIKKRLLRMGIDPVTHSPRVDLLELSSILSSSLYNSSQLHVPSFIQENVDILNLLSCQGQNPDFLQEYLRRNQLCIPQVESQFQSFHENQLQNPIPENQACTTSNGSIVSLLDENQLMQANLDNFSPTSSNFGCQNSLPNLWQNNGELSTMVERFVPLPSYEYKNTVDRTIINPLCEKQTFQSNNIQNSGFGSVLSTPSSSSTHLNSSSTTCVNGSTEDERDSYCSNMLMFNIPNRLGMDGFM
ncbi:hypothetical protein L1049_000232 [Liquidambar formosana]|uniref:Uncharacterized protein n=1 Tax=Liquidambar formosana TaxID=63359 RepID=A0AAP0NA27_LIQFO